MALGKDGVDGLFGHFWLGASVDRRLDLGPYAGLGVEFDIRDVAAATVTKSAREPSETRVEVWPMARLGLSYRHRSSPLPLARVYTLVGYRPPMGERDRYRYRVGAGASFPALLPLAEMGIPNLLELIIDSGRAGWRYGFRMGWNF